MRHFSKAAAALAVVAAGSASSVLAVEVEVISTETLGSARSFNTGNFNTEAGAERTGTTISYSVFEGASPFDNFSGSITRQSSVPYLDDIVMNNPGARIDEITFSVASLNTDGTWDQTTNPTGGGSVTTTANVSIFNLDPNTGLPDFGSLKGSFTVPGITVGGYSLSLVTVDVKSLNMIIKNESVWAGVFFTDTAGDPTINGFSLNDNMGQGIWGPATTGFSEDFFYNAGTGALSFFGGDPYANFGWEFRSVPTPGAMAIFGLAGLAATRRRR